MDRQYYNPYTSSWFRRFEKKGFQSIGRGRKGLGTKLHLGLSATQIQGACLSKAQEVDMKVFPQLFKQANWQGIQYLVVDKGYDYGAIRKLITTAGKTAVIPRRANAFVPGVRDPIRYKTRSAIERFFAKLKENKRLVARFDKLDATFFSFIALACLKILKLLC